MSERRLDKNIEKPDPVDSRSSRKPKVVFVSDSKGRYLEQCVNQNKCPEANILWAYKGGATTFDRYLWLKQNIDNLIIKYGTLSVFIWTGTCDLTIKDTVTVGLGRRQKLVKSKFVVLRSSNACSLLQRHYFMIKRPLERKNVKVTFLHVPVYSIQRWNMLKGHPCPRKFKTDDKRLTEIVIQVNEFIDKPNHSIGTYSPRLNQDLIRSRKSKNKKQRYSYRFGLYSDGIHPRHKLAKSWLKSVCRVIRKC